MPEPLKTGRLEFNPHSGDVLCPRCGSHNLHHVGVTVFDRAEDAESVVQIAVMGATVETTVAPAKGSGNPSSRRHGLAIKFACEHCAWNKDDGIVELTVAQHKGSTEVNWRYSPLTPEQERKLAR